MDITRIISQIGNAIIIAFCIFIGVVIFYVYGDDTTYGERLAYSLIFAAAIFTLLYTFKLAVIWFIKALKK